MREKTHLYIQRKIASGELAAGSGISEVSIARELGSSRTPVREAIGQLTAQGLLDQIPNRGAVVTQVTRRDIVDLYELREALEVYAAGKAARQSLRPSDLERLNRPVEDILGLKRELTRSKKAALDSAQMQRFVQLDLGFHTLLMRAAGNPRLLKIVNETRLLIRIFLVMRREGHTAADLDRIHTQHLGVLQAVARGDAESAMWLLGEHIRMSQRERLEQYDHWEHEAPLQESLPIFSRFSTRQAR